MPIRVNLLDISSELESHIITTEVCLCVRPPFLIWDTAVRKELQEMIQNMSKQRGGSKEAQMLKLSCISCKVLEGGKHRYSFDLENPAYKATLVMLQDCITLSASLSFST